MQLVLLVRLPPRNRENNMKIMNGLIKYAYSKKVICTTTQNYRKSKTKS